MYLRALLLGSCMALAGCQSTTVVEQNQTGMVLGVENISQLKVTTVKLPSTTKVSITSNTQYLNNDQISSPVAVFEIPADRGRLELSVISEIKDTVFYPHVLITDLQGETVEHYDSSIFEYRKPRLNLGNRLVADIDLYPPQGHKSLYLIVYTTPSDMEKFTYIAHPGRIDAEGRGNYMPELKDIPVAHGLTGLIELNVSGPSFLSFTRTEASSLRDSSNTMKNNITVQPDTRNYYHTEIKKAVQENNIPKALGLLDEAKSLGIQDAQDVFVKEINKSK